MDYEQRIIECVASDQIKVRSLRAVQSLRLPDWLIAAGFVRNAIWSSIYNSEVEINDIDVLYFCTEDSSPARDKVIEQRLFSLEPGLPWSVKNQARMHIRNGDEPYLNTLDAMSYWPEKQTSIGVKLDDQDNVVVRHCFDLAIQFSGEITHNPARDRRVFEERVKAKAWLEIWPDLKLNS